MKDQTNADLLKQLTPQNIEDMFVKGDITRADRNKLMRMKADHTLSEMIENSFIKTFLTKSIENAQAGWDKFAEATAAKRRLYSEGGVKDDLYYAGQETLAMLQMLTAPLAAFSEASGKKVELTALDM